MGGQGQRVVIRDTDQSLVPVEAGAVPTSQGHGGLGALTSVCAVGGCQASLQGQGVCRIRLGFEMVAVS